MLINENTKDTYCKILYNELRGIFNTSDKLNISNIICVAQFDHIIFAELLYNGKDLKYWIKKTNDFFKKETNTEDELIEMNIDVNMENCFTNLKKALKEYFEYNGYFKALYEKDELAIATWEIVQLFEKKSIHEMLKEIKGVIIDE